MHSTFHTTEYDRHRTIAFEIPTARRRRIARTATRTQMSTPDPRDDLAQHLREDHRLILDALQLLESLAERIGLGYRFPAEATAVVLRFFREYVERVHHDREATWLYPQALALGTDADVALVGELAREHDDTKLLLHTLTLLWEPEVDLTTDEREQFATIAKTYAARLRRHVEQEDRHLLPLLAGRCDDAHVEERGRSEWRRALRRLDDVVAD
jgi:hemerythrin-like domain-containing protein